jgi:hypothetical protein
MGPPSPKKKNSASSSGPRQIRFVATDGQPQSKRRRVNAAYVWRISAPNLRYKILEMLTDSYRL